MGVIDWAGSNKLLLCFASASIIFFIWTVALQSFNLSLKDDLEELRLEHERFLQSSISTTPAGPGIFYRTTPRDMSMHRLPDVARPEKYDLYLYPNLENGTFTGKVNITVTLKDTGVITLHSKNLTIKSVKSDQAPVNFYLYIDYELLLIQRDDEKPFHNGTSSLEIEFEGTMKNKLVGLYKSTYKGKKGLRKPVEITESDVESTKL